jgi:hypothetical protein
MITTKKYLSILAGFLFVLAFLMTGCVKDDDTTPLSEDALFKSMQDYDQQFHGDSRSDTDGGPCGGGEITDDEDDEDDSDRSHKQ